jgi:hypothetical protein
MEVCMCETIIIDPKTIIIKTDDEKELSEVIDLITKRDKEKSLKSFLDFAASKRKIVKNYKFNREECYAK